MIYTVTLNPSLDRIVDIDELIYDDVNRILKEKRLVSGKAIYVARVIRGLGGHTWRRGRLSERKVPYRPTEGEC